MSLRGEIKRILNELLSNSKKITELPSGTSPSGSELIEVVQGGTNVKLTISQVASGGVGVLSVVAGTNITVDNTDPQNPIISAGGGGSGTVTSFSAGNLSPLFTTNVADATTTPALTFTLSTQNANKVFAGPTNGADAAPTFRVLVAADIPDLSAVYWGLASGGTLTGNNTISGAFKLTFSNSVTATGAAGYGVEMNPTVVAAANNDVLRGVSLNPTFTNGAFTGLANSVLVLGSGLTASSGNTSFQGLLVRPTYNLTSTATNTIRGVYYNPVLTSMTGVTHYSFICTSGAFSFTHNVVSQNVITGTATTTANNQDFVSVTPTLTTRATASDTFNMWKFQPTGTAGAASLTWYNLFSDTTNVSTANSPSRWAGYFLGGLRVGNSTNAASTNVLLLETTQSQTIFNVTSSASSIFSINNNSSSTVATITGLASLPANGLGVVGTFTAATGAAQMLSLNATMVAGANSDALKCIRLFPTSFTISTRTNITTYGLHYQPQATSVSSGSFSAHYGIIVDGATASINILSGFMSATPTAFVDCGAVVTAAASLRIRAGATTTAPSSPNSGDIWHEGTGNRLMFRQGGTSVELIGTSSVNSVSPTSPNRTITVLLNNTTYYIHAKTTND